MIKEPEILLVTRPLTPPWDEASKNFAFTLANEIEDYKFHILVGDKSLKLPDRIRQHHIYKGASWNSSIQKARLVLKLSRILKRNPNINIVHFLFAPTPFNTRVLKGIVKRFPVKVIQTIACFPQSKKDKINSLLFADKIITYSKHTYSHIDKEHKETIFPYINFEDWKPLSKEDRKKLRNKWKVNDKDKILLYPGEFTRLGAMEILWDGFLKIKKNIPNARLWIACRIKTKQDAIEEKRFISKVIKSGYSDSVKFLGKVNNIHELYSVSDLIVFPVSSMEGKFDFPFVLIESLACGTPILTSNIEPLPEIWESKDDFKKYVFKAGNEEQYVKKCEDILSEKRNLHLSEYVRERFDQEKVIKEYMRLYRDILN